MRLMATGGRLVMKALLAVATSAAALAGCFGPEVNPDWGKYHYVDGSGFTVTNLTSSYANPVAAALDARGGRVAVLFAGGNVTLWDERGARAGEWQITDHRFKDDGAGIAFLPNGSLLVFESDRAAAYNGSQGPLWEWEAPPGRTLFTVIPTSNGTAIVVEYDSYTAEVIDLLSGARLELITARGWVRSIAATATGSVIAASSSAARFYSGGGSLIAEVHRDGAPAISADGSRAVVGPSSFPDRWMAVIDLGAANATASELLRWSNDSYNGGPHNSQAPTYLSPSGRFAAVGAHLPSLPCKYRNAPCSPTIKPFIRVIDLDNPGHDLGFDALRPKAVSVRDDGSAFAVSFEHGATDDGYVPVLIAAGAGAMPPHIVRDPSA